MEKDYEDKGQKHPDAVLAPDRISPLFPHPKPPFPSGQQSSPDLNTKREPGHFGMNGKELKKKRGQKYKIALRMLAKENFKCL